MARRTATATRRTTRRRRREGFDPASIIELRKTIGALIGKKMASREMLAKLVGASPGSIFNWERGTAPNRHYIERLHDIAARAAAGEVELGRGTTVRATAASAPSGASASVPRGAERPVYANVVQVAGEADETWLRFGVKRPGAGHAEPVIELVVPSKLLKTLQSRR